jgi:thiopeptide-type bacteriocin biosynthesis protein
MNMNMNAEALDWVYLKIYPGIKAGGMDAIVLDVVGDVLESVKTPPWFYLRYLDERGPHIRLRFAVSAAEVEAISEEAAIRCEGLLDRLVSQPDGTYRGLIPLPLSAADNVLPTHFGVIREDYLPELEKFGGLAGMPIAERLFQRSSELARALLAAERLGEASRKTAAPSLMQVSLDVLGLEQRRGFWRRYAEHWLGGSKTAARAWREQFSTKYQTLKDAGLTPVAAASDLRPAESDAVSAWTSALKDARRSYGRCDGVSDEQREQMFGSFIHLMNNRLGIGPLEEAYLATLLELAEGDA